MTLSARLLQFHLIVFKLFTLLQHSALLIQRFENGHYFLCRCQGLISFIWVEQFKGQGDIHRVALRMTEPIGERKDSDYVATEHDVGCEGPPGWVWPVQSLWK